jgi:hypothetical protein
MYALAPDVEFALGETCTAAAVERVASGGRSQHRGESMLPWHPRTGQLACAPATATAFVVDATLARNVLTTLGFASDPTSFAPDTRPPAELAWTDPA